jgi:hypothetical protein
MEDVVEVSIPEPPAMQAIPWLVQHQSFLLGDQPSIQFFSNVQSYDASVAEVQVEVSAAAIPLCDVLELARVVVDVVRVLVEDVEVIVLVEVEVVLVLVVVLVAVVEVAVDEVVVLVVSVLDVLDDVVLVVVGQPVCRCWQHQSRFALNHMKS